MDNLLIRFLDSGNSDFREETLRFLGIRLKRPRKIPTDKLAKICVINNRKPMRES